EPLLKVVGRLDLAVVADEAEDRNFVFRHEPQGVEAAGSFTVVFEEEAVTVETVEEPLGDWAVAALAMPAATTPATAAPAANMNPKGNAWEAGHDRVVGGDRPLEVRFRVLAPRPHTF